MRSSYRQVTIGAIALTNRRPRLTLPRSGLADLRLFFGLVELSELGGHFDEAVTHASQEATGGIVGDRAAEHFQHVLDDA
jgi:hypothetical protein